ncbi:MAG TPA: CopG family transcriptional regulator [Candidatus Binatia bacterium]|nr:CopG family transcriptional regulator [Candidatus Binatia bacterium]
MANHEQQSKREERKQNFLAMAGLIGTFGAGAFAGSKREKLTVSMGADELKQVDLLVERGIYASREAFLQSAARNLLHEHGMDLPQSAAGRLTAAGIVRHNRKSLERLLTAGRQVELNVTGILRLADDVTPELACAVIKSLKVCGAFQASAEVKAALIDRTY